MGDYLDCITAKDPRYSPESIDGVVDDAIETMRKTLEPIKDKIICLLTGNHEHKLFEQGFGDPVKRLCRELNVPYAGFSCFIKIRVVPKTHQRSLIIYAHHGWSTGRKTGSVINNVEGLAQYWDADIYIVGHSHKLWGTRETKISWGGARKVIFGNTGSFLETCSMNTTGYGEKAGFPPCKLGVLKIKYYPLTEDIHLSE